MELYIDKDFLDDFYIEFNESKTHNIVKKIFNEYGFKRVFMNVSIETPEELERLKVDNELFALICSNDKVPFLTDNIEKHLFKNSSFNQTLVFMKNEEVWFSNARDKGALCFSFENFETHIQTIIDQLHFRIDLSESFSDWSFLNNYNCLDFNQITISDRYILSDKTNQKIDDNLVPALKSFISNKQNEVKVSILTKDLNPISDSDNHKKEKAKKVHSKLNRVFANYKVKFSIVINDFPSNFVMHDRSMATNFSLLECGEGFNLMPFKVSDSEIRSETIFDSYTYKRLNSIQQKQNKYKDKLLRMETTKFKMYP